MGGFAVKGYAVGHPIGHGHFSLLCHAVQVGQHRLQLWLSLPWCGLFGHFVGRHLRDGLFWRRLLVYAHAQRTQHLVHVLSGHVFIGRHAAAKHTRCIVCIGGRFTGCCGVFLCARLPSPAWQHHRAGVHCLSGTVLVARYFAAWSRQGLPHGCAGWFGDFGLGVGLAPFEWFVFGSLADGTYVLGNLDGICFLQS